MDYMNQSSITDNRSREYGNETSIQDTKRNMTEQVYKTFPFGRVDHYNKLPEDKCCFGRQTNELNQTLSNYQITSLFEKLPLDSL